ncbi:serine/threonine-protein phosphatase 7 long form homolog [Neltuma alba]|uniref:serine/threonine-protein phosphatase 7 long form homolog n=1 Tax=Neltuma alba TaxID=207710 RepID=UPI0010A4F4FF|nr:serine/threonine-protein phosphatase 7 long form homolog [Prosopis alba]
MIEPPNQILEYLRLAGFYGVARVGQFDYDQSLVSALVERWRLETHTFHTTRGECTITLEDVAIQLGLPCVGMPVIGKTDFNWQDVCEWLLGVRPPADRILGQRLLINWLEEHFNHLLDDADDVQVQQFTRAYILRLIGGYLMLDRSCTMVYLMYLPLLYNMEEVGNFSWGSAVLAHLYRELCNATNPTEDGIGGCLSLLHLWAWDRFPTLAPQQPVSPDPQSNIYPLLPPLGFRWKNVGQNPRPKWHHPDRVLRQFGRQQPIPVMPVHLGNYHTIQLRGRISTNWTEEYSNFIEAWNRWPHAVVDAPLALGELDQTSEYMQWYWRHTRRWIQRVSGDTGYVADIAE